MLLHVIAAPFRVNAPTYWVSWRQFHGRFKIVDDPAIFGFGHLRDSDSILCAGR
jgi:hypothetical protein